jgi:hypothetical protein
MGGKGSKAAGAMDLGVGGEAGRDRDGFAKISIAVGNEVRRPL